MEHKLTSHEIEQIKEGRATLIDVRSDAEVAEKSCGSAKHWDVDRMIKGVFPNIDKNQPVYVFCRAGNRSAVAQAMLTKQGFSDVHNIGGVHNVPEELCS